MTEGARTVSRDYSQPDVIRSVSSTESFTCGQPFQPFTHTEVALRQRGFYQGVQSPGWRKNISDGHIVPFQHYLRYDERSSQSGRRRLQWEITPGCLRTATIASCGIFEDFGMFPSDGELMSAADKYRSQAEGLLQDAASDLLADFDALTFAAELLQVKRLFLSLAPRIVSQLLRKPLPQAAADVWLQWQFGWRPLIADLRSIFEIATAPKNAARRKKTKSRSYSDQTQINLLKVLPNGETHRVTGETRYDVNIRAAAIADLSALAANVYINPISTAWELIPWSFVVDYFFNVGSWIKANSLVHAGISYTACLGFDVQLTRTLNLQGEPPPPGSYLKTYEAGGTANVSARLKLRVPRDIRLSTPPPINLETLSVTRAINLVALALSRTG